MKRSLFTLFLLLAFATSGFSDKSVKKPVKMDVTKTAGIEVKKHPAKITSQRDVQTIVKRGDAGDITSTKSIPREEFQKKVTDNWKKLPTVDREKRKVIGEKSTGNFGTKESALTSGEYQTNINNGPVTPQSHEEGGCGGGTYYSYFCNTGDCSCNWESRKDRRAGFYWGCYDWTWGFFDPGVCYNLNQYTGFTIDFYDYGTLSYDNYNGLDEWAGWYYGWNVNYCDCYYDGYDSAFYNGFIYEWEFNGSTGNYESVGVTYCSDLSPYLF